MGGPLSSSVLYGCKQCFSNRVTQWELNESVYIRNSGNYLGESDFFVILFYIHLIFIILLNRQDHMQPLLQDITKYSDEFIWIQEQKMGIKSKKDINILGNESWSWIKECDLFQKLIKDVYRAWDKENMRELRNFSKSMKQWIKKYLYIYLINYLCIWDREEDNCPPTDSFLKWLQWLWMSQAEARIQEIHPHVPYVSLGPKHFSHHLLLS